jgi:hypothetical protein
VLTCNQLDALSGKQLFFKAEIFQVGHIQQRAGQRIEASKQRTRSI